jgi:hypothetical protein
MRPPKRRFPASQSGPCAAVQEDHFAHERVLANQRRADGDLGFLHGLEELALVVEMESGDEAVALQAWTRLLDGEAWLCGGCLLLLP